MYMEYISIGTDKLLEEYFYQVVNSDRKVKPAGGLWNTIFFAPTFNEWLDFIMNKPFYYTNYARPDEPFKMDCVIVSLKDNANILEISDREGFEALEQKYRYNFERLSEDYDGIYLDPYKMYDLNAQNKNELIRCYSVKTLCLFDLDKVKSYKKGVIEIEPFDYTDGYRCEPFYDTKVYSEPLKVENVSEDYKRFLEVLYKELKDFIMHLRLAHPEFPSTKMVAIIREEMNKILGNAISEYAKKRDMIADRVATSLAIKSLRKIK